MKGWGLCAVLSSGIDKHGMGISQATQQDGCATVSIKKSKCFHFELYLS